MRKIKYAMLAGGAVLVSSGTLRAIEGPEDNVPPPRTPDAPAVDDTTESQPLSPEDMGMRPGAQRHQLHEAKPSPKVKSAYLGIVTGEVPGVVCDQLGLEKGTGVVVESLLPDGPAQKAGILENDILLKADGNTLANPTDVFRAVNGKKSGDSMAFDLIRRGKSASISVTLGERPVNFAAGERPRRSRGDMGSLRRHGLPDEMAEKVQGLIEESVGGMRWKELEEMEKQFGQMGGFGGSGIHEKMDQAMGEAREQMRKAREREDVLPPGLRKFDISSMATIRLMDGQGSVEMKTEDGMRKLSVRDQDGKVTWSGPWGTEEDKSAAPSDVRRRVEALNLDSFGSGKGMNLKFNFGGHVDDGIR